MATTHAFGPFRLDAEAQLLFRGDRPLPAGRRAVALLRVLVAHAGLPVTKDTLIEAAWSGLAVEESNLSVQIGALRRALGEEPGAENWIETLPRRGYRYVGPAVTRSDDAPALSGASARFGLALDAPRGLALPDKPSIAVLPFTNISDDPEQEYFVDGITEDIITALSKWRWFFVIARNSSFVYKGRAVAAKEVGEQLGVRYVLEGSARRAGCRIRVTAQLIDALSGTHIWAERYDRDFSDVFAVQDELTQCVAAAIEPALSNVEIEQARRKTPGQLAAWDHYLRGTWHFRQLRGHEAAKAIACFRQALDLDESLADAHAAIALVMLGRPIYRPSERDAMMVEVIASARKALSLDTDNLVATVVLSYALSWSDDAEAGLQFGRRATQLNGNYAPAYTAVANACVFLGRLEEGLTAVDLALRLNPNDPQTYGWRALRAAALYLLGRYTEAAACARQSLAIHWSHVALRVLAASCAQLGLIEDARDAVRELMASHHGDKSIAAVVRRYVRAEDREHWTRGLRAAGLQTGANPRHDQA